MIGTTQCMPPWDTHVGPDGEFRETYQFHNPATTTNHYNVYFEEPEGLDDEVKSLLDRVAVTSESVATIQACRRELEILLRKLGPNWRLATFGSAVNGFGTCNSDLDLTCFQEGVDEDIFLHTRESQLRLSKLLQQHPQFQVIEEIWGARIPILKLQYDGILDVDLSCHNREPLLNTQLLKTYSELDPVVRDLVVVIKQWAKRESVCGAASKYLSSYAVTLMAIYFLQVHPSTGMPCLPTWAFGGDISTRACSNVKWTCTQSLASLIFEFFDFFATKFRWGEEVVSIRVGKRHSATSGLFPQLRGRMNCPRIHIEDPFLVARNLNCVLGYEQESIFHTKLQATARILQCRSIPYGLRFSRLVTKIRSPPMADKMVYGSSDGESSKSSKSTNMVGSGRSESDSNLSVASIKNTDAGDTVTNHEMDSVGKWPVPGELPPADDEIPIPLTLLGYKALYRL
mmetsp:Transcript_28207/g.49259  ORF Transcript_28207/g.49259 Transcript_28207/m.49259 type:complete len:457 (-) Transcript_28207:24-1394(-)